MVRILDVPTQRGEVVQTSIWRSDDKCYTRVVYIKNALNEGGTYTTSASLSSSSPLAYSCHPGPTCVANGATIPLYVRFRFSHGE